MIAVDWSHTKALATFNGKKFKLESRTSLLKRVTGESMESVQSTTKFNPNLVFEQGCPLSLIYNFVSHGITVGLIDNHATEKYRLEHNIGKTDENDARIIWELANNGAKVQPVTLDDKALQLQDLYHQYCRYQKARVALENMKKAHQRQYGIRESKTSFKSRNEINPMPDLSPYDEAILILKARERGLLKSLESQSGGESKPEVESILYLNPPPIKGLGKRGGESIGQVKSTNTLTPPLIKGLGKRIWLGIIVTANPSNFKCLSAYLRFCGLTNDVIQSHKYNRHAKMLYHMLAESIMKHRDTQFRPIYDKCKIDIAQKHPEYTKLHIHNGALNRTATFLAKYIFEYVNKGENQ